jgi:hypothetical protein
MGVSNAPQNHMLNNAGGFLAYPAEYRSSGVMTFIVDQTGVIYPEGSW